jgi:hypothetical protein
MKRKRKKRFYINKINLADERRIEDEQEPISKTRRLPSSTMDDYGGNEINIILESVFAIFRYSGTRPSLQVDGPDIQYFLEGQNVRITMLLVGYPVPDITWYHDVSFSFVLILFLQRISTRVRKFHLQMAVLNSLMIVVVMLIFPLIQV